MWWRRARGHRIQRQAKAELVAREDGGGEPDPFQPVVRPSRGLGDGVALVRQGGDRGEHQESVGEETAQTGLGSRTDRVRVDPVPVVGELGEPEHVVLFE